MVDILHRVGVKTPTPEKVYHALTFVEGLAGWWTDDTKGSGDVGGVLEFRFPSGGVDMEVIELRPSERVRWRVVDGPEEWIGTTIDWGLRQNGDYTIVLFKHQGWQEPVGVHAPLQHQVGLVSDEPEVTGGDRRGRAGTPGGGNQRLAVSRVAPATSGIPQERVDAHRHQPGWGWSPPRAGGDVRRVWSAQSA